MRRSRMALAAGLLAGCTALGTGPFGGRTADEAIGPAPTPEARQCRLEILIAGTAIVMADRVIEDGDRSAAGAALAQIDELQAALANSRGATTVFRETELARARGALALAIADRVKQRILGYLAGAAVSEDQVVAGILSAGTGAAVVADAARALGDLAAGRLDLAGCQAAVDGQLARQRGRLEAAVRPR